MVTMLAITLVICVLPIIMKVNFAIALNHQVHPIDGHHKHHGQPAIRHGIPPPPFGIG
jgi:hypothetical protein